MTRAEIEMEYMAHLYRTVLDTGREPDLDEFETNELDEAIDRWAEEDKDILAAYAERNRDDAWEDVNIHE